ncbi:MAG: DMT family transporter [Acidobacteriota bacterium]
MERTRAAAIAEGLFAVVVWGASFIATKVALREVRPETVVWLRFAIGVAVLAAAVGARRQFARVGPAEFGRFAVLGFIGITFHQWLQSTALLTSRASTSGWIIAATPVFMALLARAALGERLGWLRWGGIALAGFGVLLVVTKGQPAAALAGSFGDRGDLLMLLSSPNWAVFSVLSRRQLSRHPAARLMLYVMASGWILSTVPFLAGAGFPDVARLGSGGWAAIAFLGVACSGLAYIAWFDALERLPAAQVGALLYLEPLVAMAVAAAILGEAVTAAMVAGGAVILLGVWIVDRAPRS